MSEHHSSQHDPEKGKTQMRLANKVAIISGAASGMGAATARVFAREGAKVVIADVLEHEGRQVADAIGASARFEPLDVTKEQSWAGVVAAATRHFGKLDVLVNNAGISGSAEQDFYSTEAWHRIMAPTRAEAMQKAPVAVHHRSACSGVKAMRRTSDAMRHAAKLCYRFGPLTPSALREPDPRRRRDEKRPFPLRTKNRQQTKTTT